MNATLAWIDSEKLTLVPTGGFLRATDPPDFAARNVERSSRRLLIAGVGVGVGVVPPGGGTLPAFGVMSAFIKSSRFVVC